jgi:hypothetical protein
MTNLPDSVDAAAPGVFDLGVAKLFNLGDNTFILATSDKDVINGARLAVEHAFPGASVLCVLAGNAQYTPLQESDDLRELIRKTVREELEQWQGGK